jgi:hypothetical protein
MISREKEPFRASLRFLESANFPWAKDSFPAVLSSTRNPVFAKQKMSRSRSCGLALPCVLIAFSYAGFSSASRADALEDAARSVARKVAAVPQREHVLFLSWQNHSSLADDRSEAMKQSFADELRAENLVQKQEANTPVLQVSIEETPTSYMVVASVPSLEGAVTRIAKFSRASLPSRGTSGTSLHLVKELLWQQSEPILDALDISEDPHKAGPLLILTRDTLSLYRRESDRWELQDSKRIPVAEKPVRAPRGQIQFSPGNEQQDIILLPGQSCDVAITEKLALNCQAVSRPWREETVLAPACDRMVWSLRSQSPDWSVPDRLLLRNPSLTESTPSVAELDLPGPSLSISTGRSMQGDTAVVFNLTTGNYEVYRVTLACGN